MDAFIWKARYTDDVETIRTNLCPSPAMANLTGYWTTSGAAGTLTRTVGQNVLGVYAAQRTVTANAAALVIWTNATTTITVTPNVAYTLSAYVISSVARTVRVNIDWRNSGGASISVSNGSTKTSSTTKYTRVSITATAPATAASAIIQLEVTNSLNGDTHWWSGVLFEQTGTLQPYFDGDYYALVAQPQFVKSVEWVGTAHASQSIERIVTFYDIPNINEVSIFKGRRNNVDDYGVDTASLSLVQIPNWSPAPKRGNRVQIYVTSTVEPSRTTFVAFFGRISDLEVTRGLIPALDTASISLEGLQAELSRAQINNITFAQNPTGYMVDTLSTYTDLYIGIYDEGQSTASQITYTGDALGLLNLINRTEEGRFWVRDVGPVTLNSADERTSDWSQGRMMWRDRVYAPATGQIYFSDGTVSFSTSKAEKYDRIVFRSSAEEYYNQVVIQPNNPAVATQEASTGEFPLYGLVRDTLDYNVEQADQHANYLLQNFQSGQQLISQISFNDRMQVPFGSTGDNQTMYSIVADAVTSKMSVGFRGSTYVAIVEGIQISGTLDETRITLFLSSADINAYLILDEATFGRLDFNKLGF